MPSGSASLFPLVLINFISNLTSNDRRCLCCLPAVNKSDLLSDINFGKRKCIHQQKVHSCMHNALHGRSHKATIRSILEPRNDTMYSASATSA